MDRTPEYIKMCDCPQLQNYYNDKNIRYAGCLVYIKPADQILTVLHANTFISDYKVDAFLYFGQGLRNFQVSECVWLPKQDQLQEMLGEKSMSQIIWLIRDMFDLVRVAQEGYGLTFEKLFLQVVMHELYQMKWDGDKWIKENNK